MLIVFQKENLLNQQVSKKRRIYPRGTYPSFYIYKVYAFNNASISSTEERNVLFVSIWSFTVLHA